LATTQADKSTIKSGAAAMLVNSGDFIDHHSMTSTVDTEGRRRDSEWRSPAPATLDFVDVSATQYNASDYAQPAPAGRMDSTSAKSADNLGGARQVVLPITHAHLPCDREDDSRFPQWVSSRGYGWLLDVEEDEDEDMNVPLL
jgi:hypothetical protein